MEKTVSQAVCPALQGNPQQPKLTEPSPHQASQSAARTQAVGPSNPRGIRPIAFPLGDRLVTKDVRLQAFPNPHLLPPPSSTTLSFSQALWIWAKGQVLASLRPSQGPSETPSTSSRADRTTGEAISTPAAFRGLCCLPPNPSHTHQALHRELLLTHRKGLSLRSRPELLRVLEKRQGRPGAGPGPEPTPLQEVIYRRQQRQQKKEQEETRSKNPDEQLEFMRIRESLRHQPPPQPPSP